jgi:P27 family predicted phage terminase small subunit
MSAKKGPKRRPVEASPSRDSSLEGWECPAHITGDAATAWNHIVGLLAAHGDLGRTDSYLLQCYAINYAALRQAQTTIEKDGLTVPNRFGSKTLHPAAMVLNGALMRQKTLISELGLSPSSSRHASSAVSTTDAPNQDAAWNDLLGLSA